VWIAYVLTALTMRASAFFEPARTSTIPNITSPEELMPANALSAATWSAMLAIGASVGGLVTAWLGRDVAFVINAASFFASAIFIARTRYDARPAAKRAIRLQTDLQGPALGPAEAGLHTSRVGAVTGVSDRGEGL